MKQFLLGDSEEALLPRSLGWTPLWRRFFRFEALATFVDKTTGPGPDALQVSGAFLRGPRDGPPVFSFGSLAVGEYKQKCGSTSYMEICPKLFFRSFKKKNQKNTT